MEIILILFGVCCFFVSFYVPNSGVRLDDMLSGKVIYGSKEFCELSRNWWICYILSLLGIFLIFVGVYHGAN